jgi:hypothetical protein
MAVLLLLAVSAQAGRIADSLAFQGQMTDAADLPVTGSQMVILSLWSDSTGGTMLYSEDQTVQFTNGLFSVCVGCAGVGLDDAVFSASPQLWLQVQLSGQSAMTPRTLFRSSPRSVSSSRVLGDISTSPGRVAVGDLNGDGFLDIHSSSDQTDLHLARRRPGKVKYGDITLRVAQDSILDFRDCDSDDDGLSDSRMTSTLGGGGGAGGSILLEADLDGDGDADNSVSSSTSMSSAKHAINTKGTGTSGRSISSSTSQTNATILIEADVDGDGLADNSIGGDCDDTDSELRVAHEAAHVVQQRAGATTAMCVASGDLDGDGVLESSTGGTIEGNSVSYSAKQGKSGKTKRCESTADDAGARTIVAADLDADGLDDRRISTDCDDNAASIAIDEQGVHVAITTNPDSTVFENSRTLADHKIVHRDLAARNLLRSSSSRETDLDTASIVMQIDSVSNGRARLAINSKGTSAKRVMAQASADSACIAIDESGVHVAMTTKGWDGTIKGRVCVTDGSTLKVDFDGDGDGYVSSRFGIGVLDPTNPLEHSSGAHLTAGGVWTNASDENLKENFKAVDGEEILEKVEGLPISQWNYKVESDEITHIGPTAQDFKEVFGVGSNDKTISTIDPSGIALAAIKELGRQNRELKEENKKMKDLLEDLMKKVEKLSLEK